MQQARTASSHRVLIFYVWPFLWGGVGFGGRGGDHVNKDEGVERSERVCDVDGDFIVEMLLKFA